MSYIAPNTDIILLHNCPLENSYEHTIYFANATAQYNYFYSLRKYVFSSQSYQRYTKGSLRIMQLADNLYDCNYLMFKNTSFGNKWFYAFITGVEYVSNTVSEVFYEIDVMQTWAFNYTLGQCMVEREHSVTDNLKENYVEEELETGEYITRDIMTHSDITTFNIVIATAEIIDPDTQSTLIPAEGRVISGIYSGIDFVVFPTTSQGVAACNSFIQALVLGNSVDSIVSIFMCPKLAFEAASESVPGQYILNFRLTQKASFDGYVPKNNKLYCAPYTMITATNHNGGNADYAFQYFKDGTTNIDDITFHFFCSLSPTPELLTVPINYKDTTTNAWSMDDYFITSGFPVCAWTYDTYRAWLAQNTGSLAAQSASALIDITRGTGKGLLSAAMLTMPRAKIGGTGMALGTGMSGGGQATSGQKQALNILGSIIDHRTLGAQCRGVGSNNIVAALHQLGAFISVKTISGKYAKIIDDYFTMYGYACHQLKVPNTHARPHWTYTKTIECAITGSIPANDLNTIKNVFNNGITFWTSGSEIGNYSLDNSPT